MTSTWRFSTLTCLNKLKTYLSLAFFVLFLSQTSFAAEITVFKEASSFKEKQILKHAQSNHTSKGNAGFLLSHNDLNNDLIDEYIVKPLKCIRNSFCPFQIIAFKNREPITLLQTNAYKINILDSTSFGVRDLRIFNDINNEFKAVTFKWNPYSYLYEQKEY